MKTETTYSDSDLDRGKCSCCGDISDEILIEDGRCIECIEEEIFYESTMRGL
ncbi:hypothetical protein [Flavobacterium sp.]|uniref:hypothetical protein n=1 Tax=Flavobacterium sp. TaxID=239 RepID=UPI0037519C37